MLKGISLVELAQKIEGQKGEKQDFIASTGALSMVVEDNKSTALVLPKREPMAIRPVAHGQIGARLNIPAKYYDRMLVEQPKLLADNVNTWFHANPEKRMIRTLSGNARAFLSNRYQRIEHEEIAEVALPALFALPQVQIVSAEITERRLYIQAVVPGIQRDVKVGDAVQAGVIISNSEIGFGAVSVSAMIWRLRCLNGLKTADGLRAYHVGRQIEDNAALWAEDTQKADDRAVLLKVRDMVADAVNAVRFEERVQRMAGLTEAKLEGDPAAAVEVLASKVNATQAETGGILKALIEGGDTSAWGLLNAVTAQAHTARDYDRAVEFEAMGGALLAMPSTEWKDILKAEKMPARRRRGPVVDAAYSVAA